MALLMPLPLTVSCFSKIQIGFTFLVLAHLGSPRQKAVKWVCVSVCLSVCMVSSDKLSRVFGSLLLTECSVACYFLSVQIDILCAGELLGKDHTLKFILVTRWRAKVRLSVCPSVCLPLTFSVKFSPLMH